MLTEGEAEGEAEASGEDDAGREGEGDGEALPLRDRAKLAEFEEQALALLGVANTDGKGLPETGADALSEGDADAEGEAEGEALCEAEVGGDDDAGRDGEGEGEALPLRDGTGLVEDDGEDCASEEAAKAHRKRILRHIVIGGSTNPPLQNVMMVNYSSP